MPGNRRKLTVCFTLVPLVFCDERLGYIICRTAEGSHNGSAAVLKTAGRKAMQVRVLSPPPFLPLFQLMFKRILRTQTIYWSNYNEGMVMRRRK